jgi:hypothetical protein
LDDGRLAVLPLLVVSGCKKDPAAEEAESQARMAEIMKTVNDCTNEAHAAGIDSFTPGCEKKVLAALKELSELMRRRMERLQGRDLEEARQLSLSLTNAIAKWEEGGAHAGAVALREAFASLPSAEAKEPRNASSSDAPGLSEGKSGPVQKVVVFLKDAIDALSMFHDANTVIAGEPLMRSESKVAEVVGKFARAGEKMSPWQSTEDGDVATAASDLSLLCQDYSAWVKSMAALSAEVKTSNVTMDAAVRLGALKEKGQGLQDRLLQLGVKLQLLMSKNRRGEFVPLLDGVQRQEVAAAAKSAFPAIVEAYTRAGSLDVFADGQNQNDLAELNALFIYVAAKDGRLADFAARKAPGGTQDGSNRGSTPETATNPKTYRNGRFGFSLEVPATLDAGEPPTNGDGQSFASKDGKATLKVAGAPGLSLQAVYEMALEDSSAQVTYKVAKSNWYVVSGFLGEKVFYEKAIAKGDTVAILRFEFPKAEKAVYDPVVSG